MVCHENRVVYQIKIVFITIQIHTFIVCDLQETMHTLDTDTET